MGAVLTSRYEFLAALHDLLEPAVYLEVGVQHGWSLQLSRAPLTIGIDPHPQLTADAEGVLRGDSRLYEMTSEEFFAGHAASIGASVDLAFIDGMHRYEVALQDFAGVERMAHPGAVVVFDDVLPATQEMAAREPCPGDWTGDVWKVEPILRRYRPDLHMLLVDTEPTGVLVVRNLDPASTRLAEVGPDIARSWPLKDEPVPRKVIDRAAAVSPEQAVADLEVWRETA